MSRKGFSITLSLKEQDKAELEKLASELGMMWGDRPNISKLVEAIARRRLLITPNNNWSQERITALKQAMYALTDVGKVEEALLIANLLLERSELSLPLRAEIERFVGNPPPPWRIELNQYIYRQQPFQLSYQDATGRLWNFTVRHAKIVPHEERQYLDCWCEETEGNLDVEELHHNWSLRLDRIPEAGVNPISGKWRSNLDELPVEMHIHGRLAFSYKTKNEDVESELLETSPPVRRVVRRISSTYWFTREVLRDVPDVLIISPENVHLLTKEKLKVFCQRYNLKISS
ncbi:transcriptional regulator [Scytonema hofmannii PCC 7110]|uniref:Transcriptional regulator n=1 Tax=Scytonema hofmannii PCC 7110 TaxID=128403 RepID=A0A139X3W6_9CYAN|nr:WYL domain-containing protein [Scytonema hofmannii]KYC39366.1 transcriptional regulator [Scytonema hofmannii PCC 7110]